MALHFNKTLIGIALIAGVCACHSLPQPAPGVVSNGGKYQITLLPAPENWPLNQAFDLRVQIRGPQASGLKISARMPEHDHGLLWPPLVEPSSALKTAGQEFLVRDLQLHMPGRWEMRFDVERGAVTERAQFDLVLP